MIEGTMDVHALFGDDDDLVFSPPPAPDGTTVNGGVREHRSTPLSVATSSLSTDGAAVVRPTEGAHGTHRRSSMILNALPLGIVHSTKRSTQSRRLAAKGSTPHFRSNKDAIERRLTKALCALQATYLLTPRLFGSVIADVERQAGAGDGALDRGAPSSPSALSKRLERHLSGIMELEAHAMRLMVYYDQVCAQGDERNGQNPSTSSNTQHR
jgi:hypothetical protein